MLKPVVLAIRRFLLILFLLNVDKTSALFAYCPVFVSSKNFARPLPRKPIKELGLYNITLNTKGQRQWNRQEIQIDPINDDLRYVFYENQNDFLGEKLAENDRIAFFSTSFAKKHLPEDGRPCSTSSIYEVEDGASRGRYAYLAFCKNQVRDEASKFMINHIMSERKVKAPTYTFNYSERNHILFEKIDLTFANQHKTVASDSRLRMRANLKNFFTINFDSSNIVSKIEAERHGKVGFIGFAAFYLKLLFFNIDLKLYTGISFWPEAVHIPMIMQMPVAPEEWVHPGSGILYAWTNNSQNVTVKADEQSIPRLDAKLVLQGAPALAKLGLKYCDDENCIYRIEGIALNKKYLMDFVIPRAIVEKGFFPMYFSDLDESMVALEWEKGIPEKREPKIGLYYETSGLPKGSHHWEFWLRLAEPNSEEKCPHPIKAGGMIAVKGRY